MTARTPRAPEPDYTHALHAQAPAVTHPDDVLIWPDECTWCYRKDAQEFRADLRGLHFDDCATLYVGSPEWVAAVAPAPQGMVPYRRESSSQALYLFSHPKGEFRRLCHVLLPRLSCWNDLVEATLKKGYRS